MSSATLTGLPVEILQQICQSFCWHCHGFTYHKLRETHQRCLNRRSSSCHVSDRSLENAPRESAERADDSELESSADKKFENRDEVKSSQRLAESSSDVHLWLYNGKTCLDSLSKTCRLLRAIAQPTLYHKIYLTNGPLTPQRVGHTELRPNGEKRFRGEFKVREYALQFFRVVAPNLRSLQFNWPVEVKNQFREIIGPKEPIPDGPAPFFNLTEISLIGTNNRRCLGWRSGYTSVMHLLSAVGPHLSKVKIEEYLPDGDSSQPPVWFSLEALLALLQPWKSTLRELSFNVTHYVYPRTVGGRKGIRCLPLDQDGLALFSEFDRLEILRLDLGSGFSINAAAGDPITPAEFVSSLSPRLRTLRHWTSSSIPGEMESKYTDIVRYLLEAVQEGGFPKLKTFYSAVPVPVPGGASNEAARRELKELGREFARNGIQFKLVEGGYSGEAVWSEER